MARPTLKKTFNHTADVDNDSRPSEAYAPLTAHRLSSNAKELPAWAQVTAQIEPASPLSHS